MEIKISGIAICLVVASGCLGVAPQVVAGFVSEPHQSLLDHYFQPGIVEYLATIVDLDKEALNGYCQSLTDLPRSNSITALEAYKMFILKNNTRLPSTLAEGYIRAALVANYRVLAAQGTSLFSVVYSHVNGLAATDEFKGNVPKNVDSIIVVGERRPVADYRSLLHFGSSPLPQIAQAGYFIIFKEE